MRTKMQQHGLWDRLTKGKTHNATVASPQPRQVSLKALPGADVPLRLIGANERWSLHSVMECGAEYTYLRLVRYEQRTDPSAVQAVAPIHLVFYAE